MPPSYNLYVTVPGTLLIWLSLGSKKSVSKNNNDLFYNKYKYITKNSIFQLNKGYNLFTFKINHIVLVKHIVQNKKE